MLELICQAIRKRREKTTKIFYVDVYFLINFTVDILSLYFASRFSKVTLNIRRIIISSAVGALASVMIVFLPEITVLKLTASAASLLIMVFLGTGRINVRRFCKLVFAFLIFEALFGGGTYFLWGVLDKHLYALLAGFGGGAVNKKMLLFSLLVLLAIGAFKMLVLFFTNNVCEGSVPIEIEFLGKRVQLEAFIDSGNLAVDPMDMSPVLLIKPQIAEMLFPRELVDLHDPDVLEYDVRKRIRLIPASFGGRARVLTGVKPDRVGVIKDGKSDSLTVTVAIDKEGGSYGGFEALLPSSALDNVG